MEFRETTDRLIAGKITLAKVAEACGVSVNTVTRARLSGPESRPAPPGWREALLRLVREHREELKELADELRSDVGEE